MIDKDQYDEQGNCRLCGWPKTFICHHPDGQLEELPDSVASQEETQTITLELEQTDGQKRGL